MAQQSLRLAWVFGGALALAACVGGPHPVPPYGPDAGADAGAGFGGAGGLSGMGGGTGGLGGVGGSAGVGGTSGDGGIGGFGGDGGMGGSGDAGGVGGFSGTGGVGGESGSGPGCQPDAGDLDAGETSDACIPSDAGSDASDDAGTTVTGLCALPMVCQIPQCTTGTAHPELLCLGVAQCCEL